ncbi:HAMP domain-containing histidine kinase [Bacteroides caecigallinarum]|uniref:sensor histidine kinase n=1 Tax=Bacteroides caecigallinarum TaxID=1411144 RepID=UPI00195623BF|nr:HAMP domain-containing sensor histidine kinase [Bacteroides caecigallinarum]MBM6961598.1 HAMP domain-containing histidine kinase [Bacteroides caecigallinarum]
MKLFHNVMLHVSVASVFIMTAWAVFFYWAIIDEVNDEVDDSLEDYSESLIVRYLNGEDMPSLNNGSNNQFYMYDVSSEYAETYPQISYRDEMVYIDDKLEYEPARILMTIFKTDTGYKELVVYTPTIDKLDLQRSILGWIVALYAGILLILLLLNVWIFRRNMKPLYVLLSWFNNYKIGSGYKPLSNKTKITEFKELYHAVTMSAQRNEKLYEQQKMFIGNASHEMQTPLAICLNRLEMLMEDENLTEKQMEEIAKTRQTLENITRMNKSLLLLCKIENGLYADVKEVSVNSLVSQYIDTFNDVYSYKNITVKVTEMSSLSMQINESLAIILVSNLLKNAYLHNCVNGKIDVVISEKDFTVSNTGESALDSSKIFTRFYQGSKKEGSTGLGLALIHTICRANNINISYEFRDKMHVFKVSL